MFNCFLGCFAFVWEVLKQNKAESMSKGHFTGWDYREDGAMTS